MPKRFYRWNLKLKERREARASKARAARKEEIQNAAMEAAATAKAATGSTSPSGVVVGRKGKDGRNLDGVKDGEQPVDKTKTSSVDKTQRSCFSASPRSRINKGLTVNFNSLISSMSIFMMVNFALLNLLALSSFSSSSNDNPIAIAVEAVSMNSSTIDKKSNQQSSTSDARENNLNQREKPVMTVKTQFLGSNDINEQTPTDLSAKIVLQMEKLNLDNSNTMSHTAPKQRESGYYSAEFKNSSGVSLPSGVTAISGEASFENFHKPKMVAEKGVQTEEASGSTINSIISGREGSEGGVGEKEHEEKVKEKVFEEKLRQEFASEFASQLASELSSQKKQLEKAHKRAVILLQNQNEKIQKQLAPLQEKKYCTNQANILLEDAQREAANAKKDAENARKDAVKAKREAEKLEVELEKAEQQYSTLMQKFKQVEKKLGIAELKLDAVQLKKTSEKSAKQVNVVEDAVDTKAKTAGDGDVDTKVGSPECSTVDMNDIKVDVKPDTVGKKVKAENTKKAVKSKQAKGSTASKTHDKAQDAVSEWQKKADYWQKRWESKSNQCSQVSDKLAVYEPQFLKLEKDNKELKKRIQDMLKQRNSKVTEGSQKQNDHSNRSYSEISFQFESEDVESRAGSVMGSVTTAASFCKSSPVIAFDTTQKQIRECQQKFEELKKQNDQKIETNRMLVKEKSRLLKENNDLIIVVEKLKRSGQKGLYYKQKDEKKVQEREERIEELRVLREAAEVGSMREVVEKLNYNVKSDKSHSGYKIGNKIGELVEWEKRNYGLGLNLGNANEQNTNGNGQKGSSSSGSNSMINMITPNSIESSINLSSSSAPNKNAHQGVYEKNHNDTKIENDTKINNDTKKDIKTNDTTNDTKNHTEDLTKDLTKVLTKDLLTTDSQRIEYLLEQLTRHVMLNKKQGEQMQKQSVEHMKTKNELKHFVIMASAYVGGNHHEEEE